MAAEENTAAEMMGAVSLEQAGTCLVECPFEDRLVGVLMKASGTLPIDMFSLEHVLGFLAFDSSSDGSPQSEIASRQLAVAYLPPERLTRWIREVVGDSELADAIDAEAAKIEDPNLYPPRMRIMREFVAARVLQCREALGVGTEASGS